jgi:hypothetical protein
MDEIDEEKEETILSQQPLGSRRTIRASSRSTKFKNIIDPSSHHLLANDKNSHNKNSTERMNQSYTVEAYSVVRAETNPKKGIRPELLLNIRLFTLPVST